MNFKEKMEASDSGSKYFHEAAATSHYSAEYIQIRGTKIRGTKIRGTKIRGTKIRGTKIRGTKIRGTVLQRC